MRYHFTRVCGQVLQKHDVKPFRRADAYGHFRKIAFKSRVFIFIQKIMASSQFQPEKISITLIALLYLIIICFLEYIFLACKDLTAGLVV